VTEPEIITREPVKEERADERPDSPEPVQRRRVESSDEAEEDDLSDTVH